MPNDIFLFAFHHSDWNSPDFFVYSFLLEALAHMQFVKNVEERISAWKDTKKYTAVLAYEAVLPGWIVLQDMQSNLPTILLL